MVFLLLLHFLKSFNSLELLHDSLEVFAVVNSQFDGSFKEVVVVDGDEQFCDVDVQLAGNDVGNVMYHADTVYAGKRDGSSECVLLVHVPLDVENAVAIACLQLVGDGAVALVDDNVVVAVDETEGIVARNDITALGKDELRDVLVGDINRLLAVEIFAYDDVV